MKENRLRILTYSVIAYMLIAFAWWTILLFQKNQDAFKAKKELMKMVMVAEGVVNSPDQFINNAAFKDLEKKYKRQEWMIFGEAIVFVISLVIGVWLINRGYNKAIHTAKQSKNFLLSITHELKSPIASILLTLETFLKRSLPQDKFEKLTSNALVETERLNKLVSDLLLASKMESSYQAQVEVFNINDLLKGIIEKIKAKNPEANISLEEKIANQEIKMDLLGVTSIAINLIENGIKYSFEKPDIQVTIDKNNEAILLDVADKGIGIKQKDKAKVFERFYRVGDEDTRKTKGTGLGLYIVKEIVKNNNGSITLVNNKPNGSVFKVVLPFDPIRIN